MQRLPMQKALRKARRASRRSLTLNNCISVDSECTSGGKIDEDYSSISKGAQR
jgi:hypothetical protein